ncbi:Hypothetical_protein [Hexamita inflata]|uniref:Hypothetical_protein n=1 Tax=Hexamita inflata TaxID=28002 RepID=A0AA86PNP7_9EUKA|nr:Hypothetical protein HINF_LOCUS25942 [Hexamita inflata]
MLIKLMNTYQYMYFFCYKNKYYNIFSCIILGWAEEVDQRKNTHNSGNSEQQLISFCNYKYKVKQLGIFGNVCKSISTFKNVLLNNSIISAQYSTGGFFGQFLSSDIQIQDVCVCFSNISASKSSAAALVGSSSGVSAISAIQLELKSIRINSNTWGGYTVVSEPTLILTNVYVIIALENQITVFMLIITYSINSAVHFFFTSSFK